MFYFVNVNAFFCIVIVSFINVSTSHKEPKSSVIDNSVSSDDDKLYRRSNKPEWQYEGLPIEFPARRFGGNPQASDDGPGITTPTTTNKLYRRSNKPEWQYEGLPIEFPARRFGGNPQASDDGPGITTPTTTTTTTTMNPPLDRRYRRVYNPDELASVEDYPFMAALLVNKDLWCGAVIIDTDAVLTAAHCLQLQYNNRFFREYVKMLTVRVGSDNATAGGEHLRVAEIYFHPNYKPQTLEFNFAVVKLHKNLTFGRPALKVDMVPYSRDLIIPVDKKITFLGWGSVLGVGGQGGAVLLQKLELPIYDLADCQEIYGRDIVTRNNFCAGYITIQKNVCNHDAGGPAIMDGVLVGILSFSSKRCDQPDQPAVFSTLGVAAPWLEHLEDKAIRLRTTAIKKMQHQ